jgi:hypothetical protein
LLYLEIHLQLDALRDEIQESCGIMIPKLTIDSEEISQIKKTRKILEEGENFELLKYLYHKS